MTKVKVDLVSRTAVIEASENADDEVIKPAIDGAGYEVVGIETIKVADTRNTKDKPSYKAYLFHVGRLLIYIQ